MSPLVGGWHCVIFIVLLTNSCNVLVGDEFTGNVRLDLVIYHDVLHNLTKEVSAQRVLVHISRVCHFVGVVHHNVVDGRFRVLNLFSSAVPANGLPRK